jgi:lactate permease
MWNQVYDPLHQQVLSTAMAAIPVVTLLVLLASGKVKAHISALIALAAAILVATVVFTMPTGHAIRATLLGIATGLFPIGWIESRSYASLQT